MGVQLKRVKLRGYKTIKDLGDNGLELRPLNVLIGANGAGKSNFISFFRLLSWSLGTAKGDLQVYISKQGGASKLLHDGPDYTKEIEAEIRFKTEQGDNDYSFRLVYTNSGDTFIFADERIRFSDRSFDSPNKWIELGAGQREAQLLAAADSSVNLGVARTAKAILHFLRECKVFQFHNTSDTAPMRRKWRKSEGRWLKEDAGNIAPFLYHMRRDSPSNYRRVIETLQLIVPFFNDFVLEPEFNNLQLQWRERGGDIIFDASQASDGMLRSIALVSLLSQPVEDLPGIIILDEPELGLHPYAITVIAGLIRSVSKSVQIILSTQSTSLVDCFEPIDIIVVDRKGRESIFRRYSSTELGTWLEDYSVSELWEKNVLGGRP